MAEALPNEIQLEVVTPDRQVVHETVDAVTIPGKRGYLGILPGHSPLLSELAPGEITYNAGGAKHRLAVSWGFAEVLPDRVIVLARRRDDVAPGGEGADYRLDSLRTFGAVDGHSHPRAGISDMPGVSRRVYDRGAAQRKTTVLLPMRITRSSA